jgi:hypothetical protein
VSTAEGVDAGVEVAVRVSQGYCIYAGCFVINVIPPPLSFLYDFALNKAASSVPGIGAATNPNTGVLGGGTTSSGVSGHGLVGKRRGLQKMAMGPGVKFNTATAWIMGDGLGAPFAVGQAAEGWFDAAGHLGRARARLEELAYSLSSDQWSGDDREAFMAEVRQLAQQVGDAELFAQIVGFSLVGATFGLGFWPLGCTFVGVLQFANASLFYAAVASIVGNLGPSEAIYAQGLATAVTCNRNLALGARLLNYALLAAAGGIVGGALLNAGQQESHGDDDAWADLSRATVEMAVEEGVKNLAASGIRALTPWPVDAINSLANPGKNNDGIDELVDQHVGSHAEEAGDRAGQYVVPDDGPDRGPFSGG